MPSSKRPSMHDILRRRLLSWMEPLLSGSLTWDDLIASERSDEFEWLRRRRTATGPLAMGGSLLILDELKCSLPVIFDGIEVKDHEPQM